jgi:hypothetical protein
MVSTATHISGIKEDIGELKINMAKIKTALENVEDGINKINGTLAAHDNKIYEHEGFIKNMQGRIMVTASIIGSVVATGLSLVFGMLRK